MPLVSFYISRKNQKTRAFLLYLGVKEIERDQWHRLLTKHFILAYDYLKLALDKLMADPRDAVIEEIQNTLRDYSDNKKLSNMMNNMLKDLTQNIEAENYEDDPDWFEGLENIPKKDKGTKSDVMRYQAKQRIKSYYSKLKENIEVS